MLSPDGDIAKRANALAHRLRLVQADFVDQPEQARREILAEEVERALKGMTGEDRQALLLELGERFPAWDQNVQVAAVAAAPQSTMDQKELRDPSFLVSRLEALAGSLSEAERTAIAERLKKVGMATAGEGNLPAGPAKGLLAAVGSAEGSALDAGRVLELTEMLVAFTLVIDQLVWRIWRDLSPSSSIKRPASFKADMARFISGDQDMARGQVRDDIERLRKVLAGLTSAAPRAGELFASRHVENLAPAAVEHLATRGPMPMMGNAKETACWRKYLELARGLDNETLTRDLLLMWGEAAEKIITGGTR